jgi:hypothetical protein
MAKFPIKKRLRKLQHDDKTLFYEVAASSHTPQIMKAKRFKRFQVPVAWLSIFYAFFHHFSLSQPSEASTQQKRRLSFVVDGNLWIFSSSHVKCTVKNESRKRKNINKHDLVVGSFYDISRRCFALLFLRPLFSPSPSNSHMAST